MCDLIPLNSGPAANWYAIEGAPVDEYVVSTRQTREIVNRPELVGCDYTTLLRDGVTAALETATQGDNHG